MADFVYTTVKNVLMQGGIDFLTDDLKVVLVDEGAYTPVQATDDFLADIAVGARIATSGNLATKSLTAGVFDADDVSLTSVTGASIESIVLYKDTGSAATSNLILRYDSFTGLPYTPTGGNVVVVWPNTANKIFSLA